MSTSNISKISNISKTLKTLKTSIYSRGLGLIFLWLTHCLVAPCQAFAGKTQVELLFYERPPYMIAAADGSASGLSATPAEQAFKRAGVSYHWNKLSASRILEIVRENSIAACAVGWFKTQERVGFAKFTKAIYRDKPMLGITPKKLVLPSDITLVRLLKNKETRILVKDGFSYGPALDAMLVQLKPKLISTSTEVIQMVQMIKGNRADLTFVPEEEATYLLEQAGFRPDDFNLIRFPDVPLGEKRHIMCSKKVSDVMIQKLNAVILGKDD